MSLSSKAINVCTVSKAKSIYPICEVIALREETIHGQRGWVSIYSPEPHVPTYESKEGCTVVPLLDFGNLPDLASKWALKRKFSNPCSSMAIKKHKETQGICKLL